MELISAVVCLLLGSALPLAALFFVVRRGMRQLQVAHAYAETSRLLGLDVDTRGVSLHGHLGDRRLWIGEVMVGHGPDRRMMTWGVMDLRRPLGMGLTIRRNQRGIGWRKRAKQPSEVSLKDEHLARQVHVKADDPQAATALLTRGALAALEALLAEWPDIAVTDRSVRVHLSTPIATAPRLQQLVSRMTRLCDALEHTRAELPPAESLRGHQATFETLAKDRSLNLESWLPACHGVIDGHRVLVCAQRTEHGYDTLIRWWFAPHERIGLQLKRQSKPDGYWSVGQDIRTGDAPFDDAFVVKGWDPEQVRRVLTAEARRSLLALSAYSLAELDDTALAIEGVALDAASINAALDRALDTARHLAWEPVSSPEAADSEAR